MEGSKHHDHDFGSINVVMGNETDRLKQPLELLQIQVGKGVNDIEMCEAQIDHQSEYGVKKVQNAYREIYELLKQQEEQAIEKVKIVTIVLKKTLASQKETVISVEKQLEKCVEDCEELVRAKQSLESIEWIEQEVNKLKEKVKHINLNPKCKPSDVFVRCH